MLPRAALLPAVLALSAIASTPAQQKPAVSPTLGQRLAADLQWSPAERERRFAHMDRLFPVNSIASGSHVLSLPQGRPLQVTVSGMSLRRFMEHNRLAGVLVLQHGSIRVQQYGLGTGPQTRWTSFSVAKSFTSTLVGVAVAHGAIRSVDDPLTTWLPELRGTAYDGVTVRQLLTMTTGVRWVERYDTADSDNVRLYQAQPTPGTDPTVAYMRTLSRAHPPGTVWNYNTGEADLAGVLVRRAMQQGAALPAEPSLSRLLSTAVWQPWGMAQSASWIADDGREFGGSGISATLLDYGRFGLFALSRGAGIVPAGWFAQAATPTPASQQDGRGYGMGWWTYPDGSFAALGIFGQSILVDPRRDAVIVLLGAWPAATSPVLVAGRNALWRAIQGALDQESTPK